MKEAKRKRRFLNPKPKWLMRRLLKKEMLSVNDASIVLGIDQKNVYELMQRNRLRPIPANLPYRFEASTVKSFVRQKPGPKPKPKPKLKRFISKLKSITEGGESVRSHIVERPERNKC